MLQMLVTGLLWFSAIGCGLLAGLYFAFSAFIMTALGRIGQAAGIAAMNAINIAIVQSLFMPIFLATTAASAALVVTALLRWGEPGAMAMVAGGALYVLAVAALSDGLDVVEPRADGVIHGGLRIVHCSDRGKVLTPLSVRDNCLAPVLRKSLQ